MQTIAINQGLALGQIPPQATASAAPGGDFMTLMQQLMGQGNGTDSLGALMGQTPEAIPGMSEDEEESSVSKNYLMQLMAAMLGQGVAPIAQYNDGSGTPATGNIQMQQAAQALLEGSGTTSMADLQQALSDGKASPAGATLFQLTPENPVAQASTTELLAEGHTSAASQPMEDPLVQLQNAYNQLSKPQITPPAAKTGKPLDVDTLQQAVDSGRYMGTVGTAVPQQLLSGANPQTLDILAQVKTGILANLDKGKSEYTIKLKPEGLGEITVKMMEIGGKISMSITTSTQQAQNALNSEIATLRDALRPYNAEVQQIIQQDTALAQGFGEHRHQQQGRNQDQPGSGHWEAYPEGEAAPTPYTQKLASALNAYI